MAEEQQPEPKVVGGLVIEELEGGALRVSSLPGMEKPTVNTIYALCGRLERDIEVQMTADAILRSQMEAVKRLQGGK